MNYDKSIGCQSHHWVPITEEPLTTHHWCSNCGALKKQKYEEESPGVLCISELLITFPVQQKEKVDYPDPLFSPPSLPIWAPPYEPYNPQTNEPQKPVYYSTNT